jgi:hypothetical protein
VNDGPDDRQVRPRARVGTAVAFATLFAVPLLAGALRTGSPVEFLRLPAESIVVILLLLAVPQTRFRWIVAIAFGVFVVVASVVAGLDLGFEATIDRSFDPAQDWSAVVSAVGVVSDSAGAATAILIVGLIVAILVAAVIAVARAALRAERTTARSGRRGLTAATAVTAAWILCAVTGIQLWPGVGIAAADAVTTLAATSAQTVQTVREQEAFERALQSDRSQSPADGSQLTGLRGKDVVIAFLESYGEIALHDADFTAGIARVLEEGDSQLSRDGYSAQSAFLTSPTFGGVSWLAHATLQSGVWVDSQQKHDRLMASSRSTLSRAFRDAGWRTVAVVPSNTEPWPVGAAFYGFDAVVDSRSLGYRGPAFSYARIPDQYTWQRFFEQELSGAHPPVMAEIDFVSSHTPWAPLPRLVPWAEVGDGSVFDPQPAEGPAPLEVWADEQRVKEAYGRSIEYTLGAMFSFLHEYDQPDMVLVVVGDHQPARIVSGPDADRDVPVTIIAKDPAVFDEIASWQWESGVRPSAQAPTWRMDQFRDRFLEAFAP